MVQNLKIDIIYHDTPSDFEFEFNLGGCCHSRVLNSHTHDPKEMLSSLAKAVSRSRVILVVGEIYGELGLINLVSKAVSIPLVSADTKEYGITSPDDAMILNGSLPLVSRDGVLSGCIVESGPQSIILLPETKSLRKDICDNLVFPYITALSRVPETDGIISNEMPSEETTVISEEIAEEVPVDIEDIIEEAAEVAEETAEVTDEIEDALEEADEYQEESQSIITETDDAEIEYSDENSIDSGEEISFYDVETVDEPVSAEEENSGTVKINDDYVISDVATEKYDNYEEADEDDKEFKEPKPLSKLTVSILILCGIMLIIAGLLIYMLVYEPMTNSIPVYDYVKELFNVLI